MGAADGGAPERPVLAAPLGGPYCPASTEVARPASAPPPARRGDRAGHGRAWPSRCPRPERGLQVGGPHAATGAACAWGGGGQRMRACSAQRLDCAFRGVAVQPLTGGPPAETSAPCGCAGVLLQPCGQHAPCPSPLRLLVPGRAKPVMGRPELVMGREAELVPCARAARIAERGCGWLLE